MNFDLDLDLSKVNSDIRPNFMKSDFYVFEKLCTSVALLTN